MGIGSQNGGNRTVLSEINVTPFVDVMLVLLVIFMVTAPILYQGVNVNLPKTSSQPIPAIQTEKKVIVTINKDGELFIDEKQYNLSELKLKVRGIILDSGKKLEKEQVFLRADSAVPYGTVIEVMSEIKKAGVENLGLITEPI
ncbi:MAG: protein TolR, partial [Thermodesulfobacteriota bacterium]